MDILIKGMEMPTSCGYCPLRHEAKDGDECYLGASLTEYQKRPDDCPLVSIPPHGRLIDEDELNVYDISPVYGFSVMGVTEEDIIQASTIIEASE